MAMIVFLSTRAHTDAHFYIFDHNSNVEIKDTSDWDGVGRFDKHKEKESQQILISKVGQKQSMIQIVE